MHTYIVSKLFVLYSILVNSAESNSCEESEILTDDSRPSLKRPNSSFESSLAKRRRVDNGAQEPESGELNEAARKDIIMLDGEPVIGPSLPAGSKRHSKGKFQILELILILNQIMDKISMGTILMMTMTTTLLLLVPYRSVTTHLCRQRVH